jgi:hypothetical protein
LLRYRRWDRAVVWPQTLAFVVLDLKIVLLSEFAVASEYQEGLILSTDDLEIVLNGHDFHCSRNGGCQRPLVDRLHGQCEGERA